MSASPESTALSNLGHKVWGTVSSLTKPAKCCETGTGFAYFPFLPASDFFSFARVAGTVMVLEQIQGPKNEVLHSVHSQVSKVPMSHFMWERISDILK